MSLAVDSSPRSGPAANPRPRGRLSRPGVSIIAQGEPMVWLTGGAIVICIAMILGLLTFVLASGLPTFWPRKLIRFEKLDGSSVLGEVNRTESYDLDGKPQLRHLVRTGNFELTNEHFQWVNDVDLKEEGTTRPEWAITVERMEWGRFYGEPKRFTHRYPRTPTAEEEELVEIQQFLESNRWRLAAEQVQGFDEAIRPVGAALESARLKSIADFLKQFRPDRGTQTTIIADGQSVPYSDYQPGPNVTEIVETWDGTAAAWQEFGRHHNEVRRRFRQRYDLERDDLGRVNNRIENARLSLREVELRHRIAAVDLASELKTATSAVEAIQDTLDQSNTALEKLRARFRNQPELLKYAEQFIASQRSEVTEQLLEPKQQRERLQAEVELLPEPAQNEVARFVEIQLAAEPETAAIEKQIALLNDENSRYELTMVTANGQEKGMNLADIVRAYPANQLSLGGSLNIYFSRWNEFLFDEPREANSEGGVFPAIWGTVVMTLVMSLMVVPFGVLAALYLREYARAGFIVSAIRISISNLAGVPSIVFGVFGLGFFCYVFGSFIDGGPRSAGFEPLPPRSWWILFVALAICGVAAFVLGLVNVAGNRFQRWIGYGSMLLWLTCLGMGGVLLFATPYFDGFFTSALPNPTFGKGGVLWASLTLALLTLPVVIVATEEALSAVPNSLREGSYACGASKWQTIRRIVLPHAMPGIMTGMILAMARGAGEAAPLMLVGAVKLAPDLPVDSTFPFVHLDRSFMHLGFHVFDVGFQSQNSEAAKPMVFTTTLLLILIVATLNLVAVWIRSRLRKKYLGGQF